MDEQHLHANAAGPLAAVTASSSEGDLVNLQNRRYVPEHQNHADKTQLTIKASVAEESLLVQYVVLRADLWKEMGWPLGSIVAQACHAVTAALWESREADPSKQYCCPAQLDHMHKVIPQSCNSPLADHGGMMTPLFKT